MAKCKYCKNDSYPGLKTCIKNYNCRFEAKNYCLFLNCFYPVKTETACFCLYHDQKLWLPACGEGNFDKYVNNPYL